MSPKKRDDHLFYIIAGRVTTPVQVGMNTPRKN